MQYIKTLFTTLTFIPVLCIAATSPSPSVDHARDLVVKSTNNQVTIEQEFSSIGNLMGFVVKGKEPNAKEAVIYADKAGQYLLMGTVVNKEGLSLTHEDYVRYVPTHLANETLQQAAETHWFLQGNANAKHTAYVLAEPNCYYTYHLYKDLTPFVKSGDLAIRWILVDFIKSSSRGKAAAILQSANAAEALEKNAAQYRVDKQEGGMDPSSKITDVTKKSLQINDQFMAHNGLPGTPVMIYKTTDGNAHIWINAPQKQELANLVQSIGNSF